MEKVQFGKTDLMVSPAGLGCGGHSRLGMTQGNSEKQAEQIVRHAMSLGVNQFDTARAYGTEEIVGRAMQGRRDEAVISTKTVFMDRDGNYMPAEKLIDSLEKSLGRLKSDYVDVFSLHGVTPEHLQHVLDHYVPVLQRQIELGKIRHLGITESFADDPAHEMLERAIPSGAFNVVMVGFNFLNSGAKDTVFPLAIEHGVATQVMHAVRRALSNPYVLIETVEQLILRGELDSDQLDPDNPLGFLDRHPGVESITEAAYRYCRHESGVSVVLTGTGSIAHLESNLAALTAPRLDEEIIQKINDIFGQVRSISGD